LYIVNYYYGVLLMSITEKFVVPWNQNWDLQSVPSKLEQTLSKKDAKKKLKEIKQEIIALQDKLYAERRRSILIVFQAMDASGKDGTIRAVFSGLNPQGCHVVGFKRPTKLELDHDYLWRIHKEVPPKGWIHIFNRSHYEEVLVTSVFPNVLDSQKLPELDLQTEMSQRFENIRNFEQLLSQTGTEVIKFWLNVSQEEQSKRLLCRTEDPNRYWKHEHGDMGMRKKWGDFMAAYQEALTNTSRSNAPWYAIPADDKPQMRLLVAQIVLEHLKKMDPQYPEVSEEDMADIAADRQILLAEQK